LEEKVLTAKYAEDAKGETNSRILRFSRLSSRYSFSEHFAVFAYFADFARNSLLLTERRVRAPAYRTEGRRMGRARRSARAGEADEYLESRKSRKDV